MFYLQKQIKLMFVFLKKINKYVIISWHAILNIIYRIFFFCLLFIHIYRVLIAHWYFPILKIYRRIFFQMSQSNND